MWTAVRVMQTYRSIFVQARQTFAAGRLLYSSLVTSKDTELYLNMSQRLSLDPQDISGR